MVGPADRVDVMTSAAQISLVAGVRGGRMSSRACAGRCGSDRGRAAVTADRVHDVLVRGSGNAVGARRGFRTVVVGDGNAIAVPRRR